MSRCWRDRCALRKAKKSCAVRTLRRERECRNWCSNTAKTLCCSGCRTACRRKQQVPSSAPERTSSDCPLASRRKDSFPAFVLVELALRRASVRVELAFRRASVRVELALRRACVRAELAFRPASRSFIPISESALADATDSCRSLSGVLPDCSLGIGSGSGSSPGRTSGIGAWLRLRIGFGFRLGIGLEGWDFVSGRCEQDWHASLDAFAQARPDDRFLNWPC